MKISGISAVVTGGASGMGAATARHLASLGAKVALLDINAANCEAVAKEIGGGAFTCDITDAASAEVQRTGVCTRAALMRELPAYARSPRRRRG